MLLANVLVAKYIFNFCKDKAILRVHNDIVQEKKDKLNEFLDKVGIAGVDLTNAKSLSQSMQKLQNEEDKLSVLNRKILTCLTQAKYISAGDQEEYLHFGLNFDIYTHFTSPIRRYADILVHRLLTISLKEQE